MILQRKNPIRYPRTDIELIKSLVILASQMSLLLSLLYLLFIYLCHDSSYQSREFALVLSSLCAFFPFNFFGHCAFTNKRAAIYFSVSTWYHFPHITIPIKCSGQSLQRTSLVQKQKRKCHLSPRHIAQSDIQLSRIRWRISDRRYFLWILE